MVTITLVSTIGLIIPVVLTIILICNTKTLDQQEFKSKYVSMYERNKTWQRKYVLYILVFFIRRLVFTGALIMLMD